MSAKSTKMTTKDNIFVTYCFVIQTAMGNPDGTVTRSYDGFSTRSEMESVLSRYRRNLNSGGMKEGKDYVMNIYVRDEDYDHDDDGVML